MSVDWCGGRGSVTYGFEPDDVLARIIHLTTDAAPGSRTVDPLRAKRRIHDAVMITPR